MEDRSKNVEISNELDKVQELTRRKPQEEYKNAGYSYMLIYIEITAIIAIYLALVLIR